MAEFKPARLRFTWFGTWVTGTVYARDGIVQYQGKTYTCQYPHTASASFYTDLNSVDPVTGKNYWAVQIDGKTWKGAWSTGVVYSLGNIVQYGGAEYYCAVAHTSGATFATNSANWAIYVQNDKWEKSWTSYTQYGLGDIVQWGGIIYRCITNHTSAGPTGGLEIDQANWTVYYSNINYLGAWTSGNKYKVNDLVKVDGELFRCTAAHISLTTFDGSNFTLFLPGQTYLATWSASTAYQIGDTVSYGGYDYVSLTANNFNNNPYTSTFVWSQVSNGYSVAGDWASGTTYPPGSLVRRGGWLFVSLVSANSDPLITNIVANYSSAGSSGTTLALTGSYLNTIAPGDIIIGTGFNSGQSVASVNSGATSSSATVVLTQAPDSTLTNGQSLTVVGVQTNVWQLLTPGHRWKAYWTNLQSYTIGDLVIYANITYRCINAHTSTQLIRPDLDTSNTYWAVYLLHARHNAGTTVGDLTTYNNNNYTALAIGPQSTVLRATNSYPGWRYIYTVPSVYYVATNGLDTNNGKSIDTPWKTLKYALSVLQAGTINQNALYLLSTNKEFAIAEMYNWMVYQKASNLAPFTSASVFDQTKTQRDARFIIDAIIYDITRGGNSQTVAATLAYFATSTSYVNIAVTAEMPYFVASLTYLLSLLTSILNNSSPAVNYQALNGILAGSRTNQTIDTTRQAETGTYTPANSATIAVTNSSSSAYVINATNNPILNLVRGNTYTFSVGLAGAHPFWIQTTGSGYNISSVYNKGVINNGVGNGSLIFTVPYDAPNTLYYQCQFHPVMGAQFAIYDSTTSIVDTPSALSSTTALLSIVTTALTSGNTYAVPVANTGLTYTLNVKTGTYSESLPITIPGNVAVVGDELRGVVIQPSTTYTGSVTASTGTSSGYPSGYTTPSTAGMYDKMPIQFSGTAFGGVTAGVTYYVIGTSITPTFFNIASQAGGSPVVLTTATGSMVTYGGQALNNMFYMRNGSGLRNVTLTGLLGTLGAQNAYQTQRPTGGAYVSLDPGTGSNDTSAWIYRRSPYVQNVTTFGTGCVGLKIDGSLHNGGNKSIVANDFTQVLSDGVGVWVTNTGALSELVSVFTYYNYASYLAENGGKIRATNGNSSYGTYGVIAEGYDSTEVPISGTVFNRSSQIQASVQSSLGVNAQLLKLSYANAGSGYYVPTTNMLSYSNVFNNAAWTANNITFAQNITSPNYINSAYIGEGWTLTGTASSSDTNYIYQNIIIPNVGATYTGISGTNISGSGSGATFNVSIKPSGYTVVVNAGGSNYVTTNQIRILGSNIGGIDTTNDIVITVASVSGTTVLTITSIGTVPAGVTKPFILSAHVKQTTSTNCDMYAFFSGSGLTYGSYINYNFATNTVTAFSGDNSGSIPSAYGAIPVANGWYRIWMAVTDASGLSTQLQQRIYTQGRYAATTGSIALYGAQIQIDAISYGLSYYLETQATKYTAYASYYVTGSGTGAVLIGDETRSQAVFNTRVLATGNAGGASYLTASNSAQSGNTYYITLAASDVNTITNYYGMRLFITSGLGTGQYGYITAFDSGTKIALVAKDSFQGLTITSSDNGTGRFTLASGDTTQMYLNQRIQFIPTQYALTLLQTSYGTLTATQSFGGTVNTIRVNSTANLKVGAAVQFIGGSLPTANLTGSFTYYVTNIVSATDFQISTTLGGGTWPLSSATFSFSVVYGTNTGYIYGVNVTGNMSPNQPIVFSGAILGGVSTATTYYINDIIDNNNFTIANSLVTVTPTASSNVTNSYTVSSTSSLTTFNPIYFTGTVFGNAQQNTKYYVSNIKSATAFSIVTSLISTVATATATTSNLITVTSTSGFIANQPIVFTGNTFGGILTEKTYYIAAVNDGVSFTISLTPSGAVVGLTTGVGQLLVRTSGADFALSTVASGSMTGTTTAVKRLVTQSSGTMIGTISTSLFGGISAATQYYVLAIPSTSTFTITATDGGVSPVSLTTTSGSMTVVASGWDHVVPGTTLASLMDSSTQYFIEPRLTYSDPTFTQTVATVPTLTGGATYSTVTYGQNYWIAMASSGSVIAGSTDGVTWSSLALPTAVANFGWVSCAYGNGYWVAIAFGDQRFIVSSNNGAGWRVVTATSPGATWSKIAYGAGTFVAIASAANQSSGTNACYSLDHGTTWSSITTLATRDTWRTLVYGAGKWIAVGGTNAGGVTLYNSTDGITWAAGSIPAPGGSAGFWGSMAFGNGRFVAVGVEVGGAARACPPVYSIDGGTTWIASSLSITANNITYGNGVFLATNTSNATAYTSEDGFNWKQRTVSASTYTATTFGYSSTSYNGLFVTVGGASTGTNIATGATTKGRVAVVSNTITSINEFEPGSGYVSTPTVTVTDPNATVIASVTPRLGNGAVANPTIVTKGTGYSFNTTYIGINGNGYSNDYQTGYTLILNNLTRTPAPGDNLTISGSSQNYKVTSSSTMFGTVAPNIEANIQINPSITASNTPEDNTAISIRTKYSQVRLTNHDFLNIGFGNFVNANYPNQPTATGLQAQNQTVETNYGRVFYSSTDQDGNFKVGNLFGVQQATGIVTLSVSQFGLGGLSTLSLGGIAVGGSSVIVTQFSTDGTFSASSDSVIPTQRAIKTYLNSRLSQGGSNTYTGNLIAGSIQAGNPNTLSSTVPVGIPGSTIQVPKLVTINKLSGATVGGYMATLPYFAQSFGHGTVGQSQA